MDLGVYFPRKENVLSRSRTNTSSWPRSPFTASWPSQEFGVAFPATAAPQLSHSGFRNLGKVPSPEAHPF